VGVGVGVGVTVGVAVGAGDNRTSGGSGLPAATSEMPRTIARTAKSDAVIATFKSGLLGERDNPVRAG